MSFISKHLQISLGASGAQGPSFSGILNDDFGLIWRINQEMKKKIILFFFFHGLNKDLIHSYCDCIIYIS